MRIIFNIKEIAKTQPLTFILALGIIFRLLAVIFAKGFGMHDDHFLVIEAPQSWLDGTDYNRWLPASGASEPSGHSFFYPGLHYCLFYLLKLIGTTEPQTKMFVVRLLHAAWSLLIIVFGYKIAEKLTNRTVAFKVGMLLSLLFYMPWLSVRNLVEFVCIPLLMWGVWITFKDDFKSRRYFFISGLLMGIAMSIRFQTLFFIAGYVLSLLLMKKGSRIFYFIAGFLLSFSAIQGIADWYIWKRPFAEVMAYFAYNLENPHSYITHPWYQYVLVLLGFLIPPASFLMLAGFFNNIKKRLFLFLPVLFFLFFHSIFPNKQERFILPILPFFIILGVCGWYDILNNTKSIVLEKITKVSIIFLIILNLLLLPVFSTMYSKRSRVESMAYLSKYPNIKVLLMEDAKSDHTKLAPFFYLKQWDVVVFEKTTQISVDSLRRWIPNADYYPRFVLFHDTDNIQQRVQELKTLIPELEYETTIEPGFVDEILYRLNPANRNQTVIIYRNKKFIP